MRPGASDEVMSGSVGWRCVVSSWLGGRLLAADVPVVSGRMVWRGDADVPESVTLRVPRYAPARGESLLRDWRPGSDTEHPLAGYGQTLDISVVVTSAATGVETATRLGRVLVDDWDGDDEIEVHASGLLTHTVTSRLTSPVQPVGSLASEARRLVPAGMGVSIDPALVDRACPRAMVWSAERRKALGEIADAWPALIRSDAWGQVVFRPPLPEVPVPLYTLRDGERGTLVGAPRSFTRDGAYNEVVARSSAPGVEGVQAVAQVTSGPMAVGGPYGVVTKEWASPLIETIPQAAASARTMLANSQRPATILPVTCAPDPRYELDDPVQIVRDGGSFDRDAERYWGWVVGVDLPLTVNDGDMRLDIAIAQ